MIKLNLLWYACALLQYYYVKYAKHWLTNQEIIIYSYEWLPTCFTFNICTSHIHSNTQCFNFNTSCKVVRYVCHWLRVLYDYQCYKKVILENDSIECDKQCNIEPPLTIDNRVGEKGIGNACIILASMCIKHLQRCTVTFHMIIWVIPVYNVI